MSLDATFSSDTEQDWLKINRSHERSGEEGLMLAVLQDALSVIRNGEPRAVDGYLKNEDMGRLVNEARAWVMSNDSSWPFSFVSICDSLWRAQSDSRIWQEIHAHMRMEDYRSVWLRDHEAIFEAVSAGNARKASAAMTRHLGNIRDALMEASNAKSMARDKT